MIMIPPSPSLTQVHCRGSQTSLAQGGSEGIGLKMYKYRDYAMGPIFGEIKRYQCMDLCDWFPCNNVLIGH